MLGADPQSAGSNECGDAKTFLHYSFDTDWKVACKYSSAHLFLHSVSNNVKVGSAGKMLKCVHSYGTVRSSGTAISCWVCGWNPKCDNLNESYWVVLSCGTVYCAVQGGSNFWVCGWNPRRNRVTIYMKVPGRYRVCPFQSVLLSIILCCWWWWWHCFHILQA